MQFFLIFLLCFLGTYIPLFSEEAKPENKPSSEAETDPADKTFNFAKGYQEFRDVYFRQHEREFLRLVRDGQHPKILFIGCSDSRVVPDLILGSRPGELFIVRTAGNFVPPYQEDTADGVAASIQFAIEVLNIKHIIVCGHSHCGAIKGLFNNPEPGKLSILQRWLKIGEPTKKLVLKSVDPSLPKEEFYEVAEKISVVYQLKNLMGYPFVKERVYDGLLHLHGWYYTIETGEIEYYDDKSYRFLPLDSLNAQL